MKLGFTDEAACDCREPIDQRKLEDVTSRIEEYYKAAYTYTVTETGFEMKPKPRFGLYHNSFWPELVGFVSGRNVTVRRRPVRWVRGFMGIWFGGLAFFEGILIFTMLFGQLEVSSALLSPVGMALAGYLMAKVFSELFGRPILKCTMDALGR